MTPHDPKLYRCHGGEIQAALEWAAMEARANQINQSVRKARAIADRMLFALAVILAGAGVCIVLAGLARYAIDAAEAMPLHIEGFE